ncbi:hypothetical protein OQA88_1393 [Cercophora sp. LCS_1]
MYGKFLLVVAVFINVVYEKLSTNTDSLPDSSTSQPSPNNPAAAAPYPRPCLIPNTPNKNLRDRILDVFYDVAAIISHPHLLFAVVQFLALSPRPVEQQQQPLATQQQEEKGH